MQAVEGLDGTAVGGSVHVSLRRLERRRAELWSAALFVAVTTTVAIALYVTADDLIPRAFRPGGYRSWTLMVLLAGLALAFVIYVLDKERQLHLLTVRLVEEQTRSTALSNRLAELSRLSELGKAVNTVLELDDVLDVILSSALELIGGDDGSVMLLSDDRKTLEVVAHHGADDELLLGRSMPVGRGISGTVAETGKPVLMQGNDMPEEVRDGAASERPIHSSICVPLHRRDQMIGVLNLNEVRGRRRFTDRDLSALNFFAEHAAIALSNARLYERERETAQRLIDLDQLRSDFVATMSHELRTPLTAIVGALKIMSRKGDDMDRDQRLEFMGIMRSQADRLMRLVEDVLVTARIEQGPRRIHRELIDLREVAGEVVRDLSMTELGRDRRIEIDLDPDRPTVWGDENAIRRVVINLVTNALKYSGEDTPVTLAMREMPTESIIEVIDRGRGIPADKLDAIFGRFEQIDRSQQDAGGIGMGLYIVGNLVDAHGGRVEVDSRVGVGSTFSVYLPKRRNR